MQSFLSILGGLRETRLTAVLGFLVTRFPREFGVLLGFQHSALDEVSIEETHEGDRYDMLIRQSGETHIIEGKIGPNQNLMQLLRYIQSVRHKYKRMPSHTVVDDGSEFRHSQDYAFRAVKRRVKTLKFVTWTEVAAVCRDIVRKILNFAPCFTRKTAEALSHENIVPVGEGISLFSPH
jgi:hypothetical protein